MGCRKAFITVHRRVSKGIIQNVRQDTVANVKEGLRQDGY